MSFTHPFIVSYNRIAYGPDFDFGKTIVTDAFRARISGGVELVDPFEALHLVLPQCCLRDFLASELENYCNSTG